jgi:hypothetical protein
MEVPVETLLVRVHDSSGSVITANSRRLRTLRHDPSALAQCRSDVEDDITMYTHVSVGTKARCVDRFAERAEVQMRVCGACGIRDPFDMCDKIADFNEIMCDHWLRVGQDAFTRLKQSPSMDLLRPDGSGGYETLSIPRTDFHNLLELGDCAYHGIPEAVMSPPGVRLCKR